MVIKFPWLDNQVLVNQEQYSFRSCISFFQEAGSEGSLILCFWTCLGFLLGGAATGICAQKTEDSGTELFL